MNGVESWFAGVSDREFAHAVVGFLAGLVAGLALLALVLVVWFAA